MNLRALANRSTRTINPNLSGTVRVCTGYTTAATGKRVATYAAPVPATLQVQSLSIKDHEHLQALNITTAERSVFCDLQLSAVLRPDGTGGDLMQFEDAVWLVVAVLEGWTTSGWGKYAVVQQMDAVV